MMHSKKQAEQMVWAMCIGLLLTLPLSMSILASESGSNKSSVNDLVVDTTVILDRSTAPSGILGMDGNITINSGGNLTVKGIEIQFLQDGGVYPYSPKKKYTLVVNSGGILYLEDSAITVSVMMVNPYLKFNLTCNGGKIVMKNSRLSFPGYLYLNGAEVYMNESTITGLSEMPSVWANDAAKTDDNDDAPVITAINSKIYIADSKIEKYYENVNIVDYQITPKDFPGYVELNPGEWLNISQLDTTEIAYEKLSKVSVQIDYTTTSEYNGSKSFEVSYNGGTSWEDLPLTPNASEQVSDVIPLSVTTLAGLEKLRFRFNHNGTTGNITITRFDVIVRPAYEFNFTLYGSTQMTVINSNISIDWDSNVFSFGTSNKLVLYDSARVELLNVGFDEAETPPLDAAGHGQKYAPAIFTFNTSQVIIYRWAKIPVYDQNRMPIQNAQLTSLEYTPSSSMIQYNLAALANDLNAHPLIKMYLTANGITNRSDASGIIRYPVASDVINVTTLPNSIFIGSYIANCTYQNTKRGSGIITLPPYPDLVEEDNIFETSPVGISIDLPNLKITNLFTTPAQPLKGDVINLTASVENNGLSLAKGVIVRFEVNGVVIGDSLPADITPGSSQNLVYQYTFDASGIFSINATVDPDNSISEMSENDNTYSTNLNIAGRPSLSIEFLFVLVNGAPSESVNVNQTAEVRTTIKNSGDGDARNVIVKFSTASGDLGTDTISSIPIGERRDAKVSWTPTSGTYYTITASIISSEPTESISDKGDNTATKSVIITYPDLQINAGALTVSPEPTENGSTTISVEIYNDGNGFASNVVVVFSTDAGEIGTTTIPKINAKSTAVASINWDIPSGIGGSQNVSVQVTSCTEGVSTQAVKTNIYVKYAAKLSMASKVWFYDTENTPITSTQYGSTVVCRVNLTNDGDLDSSSVSVDFYLDGLTKSNFLGKTNIQKVPGKGMVVCEFTWVVTTKLLNASHTIYAKVNNTGMNASNTIFVERLTLDWDARPFIKADGYSTTEDCTFVGKVKVPENLDIQMGVTLYLKDASTGNVVTRYPATVASDGQFVIYAKFDKPGKYILDFEVAGADVNPLSYEVPNVVEVNAPQQGGIPSWLILIIVIIIIIVVVVIVVLLLLSRMGIGKLGECGECGAPIPENATKCPKCGAEFETSTVRCSECGAWIPANAKTCPECGTTFTGKKVEATSHEKTMRQQYEAYVEKYRAQAKREMGASFSEAAFWRWWRTQPTYMTYNQWLNKEEKAKRATVKCPSCGAINEAYATVCYRCGTSMLQQPPAVRTAPPAEEYRPPVQQPLPQYAPPQPQYQPPPAYAPPRSKPVVLKSSPPAEVQAQVPPPPQAPVPPKKVIRKPEPVMETPEKPLSKVCPKCGKEISNEFVVCPYCGAIVR
ncbi:MAG: CARDB domain-containing protein [Thermoplasmata archaeon]